MTSTDRRAAGATGIDDRWLEAIAVALLIGGASLAVVLRVVPQQLVNADFTWIELLYRDLFVRGWPIDGWTITPAPYLVPDLLLFFAARPLFDSFLPAAVLASTLQTSLLLGATIWMLRAITRARVLTLAVLLSAAVVVLRGPSSHGLWALDFLYTGFYHSGVLIFGVISLGCLLRWRATGQTRWLAASAVAVFAAATSDGLSLVFPLGCCTALVLWSLISRQLTRRAALLFLSSHGVAWVLGPMVLRLSELGEAIPNDPLIEALREAGIDRWRRTLETFGWFVPSYFTSANGVIYLLVMLAGLVLAVRGLRRADRRQQARRFFHGAVLVGTVMPIAAVLGGGNFIDMTQVNYFLPMFWLPLASVVQHLARALERPDDSAARRRRLSIVLCTALAAAVPIVISVYRGWSKPDNVLDHRPPVVSCLERAIEEHGFAPEELPVGFAAYWPAKKLSVFSEPERWVIQLEPDTFHLFNWITNRRWFEPPVVTLGTSTFIVVNDLRMNDIIARVGPPDMQMRCEPADKRWAHYLMYQPHRGWRLPHENSGVLIYLRPWHAVARKLVDHDPVTGKMIMR